MVPQQDLRKLTFRVPQSIVDELDSYAESAGVTRSALMSMAVVIGARALARQLSPEKFVTPELLQQMRLAGFDMPAGDLDE